MVRFLNKVENWMRRAPLRFYYLEGIITVVFTTNGALLARASHWSCGGAELTSVFWRILCWVEHLQAFICGVAEVTEMNTSNWKFEGYHLFNKHMEGNKWKRKFLEFLQFCVWYMRHWRKESPLILSIWSKLYGVLQLICMIHEARILEIQYAALQAVLGSTPVTCF
jgi:hypothetical protein